jgi:alkylated DNA repair protein alkB family protein 1
MESAAINTDPEIIDFKRGLTEEQKERIVPVETVPSELMASAAETFRRQRTSSSGEIWEPKSAPPASTVYEHKDFPGQLLNDHFGASNDLTRGSLGLRLLPSFLPPECQILMLDALFHRDLSNPLHTTNLTQDYTIPYPLTPPGANNPASFFTYAQNHKSQTLQPKDEHSANKPLNTAQFLQKKLRWLTLGSQYDWSTRSYPRESPTQFPDDIATLVRTLFRSSFEPESGVVLLYSPKDYMPVHRDVSEESPRGLASFSLGCDGLFIISSDRSHALQPTELHSNDQPEPSKLEQPMVVIRVRSGDVIQMSDETRWAWHAMPKVMAGTCPDHLADWPVKRNESGKIVTPKQYEVWRGYFKGKRVNISCRQVWESGGLGVNGGAGVKGG